MLLRKLGLAVVLAVVMALAPGSCSPSGGPDATVPLDGRGGGIIAFHSARDGNFEVYVMNADGSGQRRLTDDPAEDSAPSISPDGSAIVFISNRTGNFELYAMGVDRSNLTRLTATDADEAFPSWTPDGERVVFSTMSGTAAGGDIWIMDAAGGNPRQLTNGVTAVFPVVTADGATIIYGISPRPGDYDVWAMSIDGTGAHPIAATDYREVGARPSPDGQQIVFAKAPNMASPRNIYLMNIDGSNVRPLTQGTVTSESPCWSPDGTRIVFQSDRSGSYNLYVMNADGTGATNLTRHGGDDFAPHWADVGR